MDRSYLAPHRVRVFKTQADKDAGAHDRIENLVPYPSKGFDNYKVDGVMYPGFQDPDNPYDQLHGCVVLDQPLFPRADRPVYVR